MANVRFSRNEFEKEIKITKEIEEKIPLFGTPLESVGEDEIEIEIMPNRPDLLSLQGYLRSFKAFIDKDSGLRKYSTKKPEKDFTVKIDSSVNEVRPYTACAIVKGLKIDDEKIKVLIDLQEKLHSTVGRKRKKLAIGIYPLEKISLPIRFEARKPQDIKFIPLEFDKELNGLQILQKTPTGREYAHLLEGKSKYPVFVDAKGKILSMPPIINSQDTGKITDSTKDVFVECSGFDFNILKKTLNIIVTTLADMGGVIYQMNLDYKKRESTPDLTPEKMKISLDNVNSLLGLSLSEKDIEKLLPKMGFEYKNKIVTIPAWRFDILHEVDIIEDIAVAYGYNNLVPHLPSVSTTGEENPQSMLNRKVSEVLCGLGLLETSSYHLVKEDEIKMAKINEKIETIDSKSEYKILRPSLIISALRIISENKDNEYPQEIFEIGTVFEKDHLNSSETGVLEIDNLIVALTPGNFTRAKQILEYLIKMISLESSLEDSLHPLLIEGRTGLIKINGNVCGYIGEVHPQTLRDWNIKMPISLFEINLSRIHELLINN
jgi:phenylalanyl-tRNA synthetase beta chain